MNNFQSQKHGIKLVTNQVPRADNNHTAVVTATLHKIDSPYSGIGVGQPDNLNGSVDCQALLDNAVQTAIRNAKQMAGMAMSSISEPTYKQARPQASCARGHRTERGSISSRQRDMLENMASRHGTNLDNIAREKFGVAQQELSSEQGNVLIQKLAHR